MFLGRLLGIAASADWIRAWTKDQAEELKSELECNTSCHFVSAEVVTHPGFAFLKESLIRISEDEERELPIVLPGPGI